MVGVFINVTDFKIRPRRRIDIFNGCRLGKSWNRTKSICFASNHSNQQTMAHQQIQVDSNNLAFHNFFQHQKILQNFWMMALRKKIAETRKKKKKKKSPAAFFDFFWHRLRGAINFTPVKKITRSYERSLVVMEINRGSKKNDAIAPRLFTLESILPSADQSKGSHFPNWEFVNFKYDHKSKTLTIKLPKDSSCPT